LEDWLWPETSFELVVYTGYSLAEIDC